MNRTGMTLSINHWQKTTARTNQTTRKDCSDHISTLLGKSRIHRRLCVVPQ